MCIRDRCVCVVDGKTNMLESNQKELGQQVIIENDNLKSLTSKAGNKFENGVSKSDTVNNSSNIESRKSVDISNEVVISIDERMNEIRSETKRETDELRERACMLDNKTDILVSNQKEFGQQVIIVNDNVQSRCV